MATVFTVGHGARTLEEFMRILDGSRIELLLDVRRYPGSRRHPHFGREALHSGLAAGSVEYQWWGESMGGRRKAPEVSPSLRHSSWDNASFRAFASHMEGPAFRAALADLVEISERRRAAVMCAETLWWRCHRRLIADAILVAGCEVIHLGVGDPQLHRLSESVRVQDGGLLVYDLAQK